MVTFIFFAIIAAVTAVLSIFVTSTWYFILLWLVCGIVVSGVTIFLLIVLMMPMMKVTKKDWVFKYWFLKGAARFCNLFALGLNVKVIGKKNIPKTGKLTIYANHKSQLDPFVIMSQINRPLAFTPKISIYKVPILAQYMDYVGCLPIDRNDNRRTAKTMIEAVKQVENGHAMLIFPEGGILDRSTEEMVDVKGGAYKIGMKAGSDFLPMTIVGASTLGTRKWYQRRTVRLIVHKPIKYENVKDLSTLELGEMIFEIINRPLK